MPAHPARLFPLPEGLADDEAVLADPLAEWREAFVALATQRKSGAVKVAIDHR
jgi:hypothetical protein